MVIKTKLKLGLGFLFLIIFSLIFMSSFYIQDQSRDSENILKDNYNSLVYPKNMFLSIDDMKSSITSQIFNTGNKNESHYRKLFETAKSDFEKNQKLENNNITEIHEKEYNDMLNKNFDIFKNLASQISRGRVDHSVYFTAFMPAYEKVRQSISNINDVNMQAVERKNQLTKENAILRIRNMAIIGSICFILGLGYLWFFPFYVSNTIAYLSDKMVELLDKNKIKHDFKSNDESYIISKSIYLLDDKISGKGKK